MSQMSPRVLLPYLQPSQAQKHVTHNEALQQLDAVTQLTVLGFADMTPPELPVAGDIHGVGAGAMGAWAGQDGMLAYWEGTGWLFLSPQPGWRAWGLADQELRVWRDGAWHPLLEQVDMLGVNTGADLTNRLSVASSASLFSHDGAGHQLKINKAADTDTASLLFQSNWTGHAEMGLAGDTAFALKLSADGQGWQTALYADPAAGELALSPAATPRLTLRDDAVQIDAPITGSAVQAGLQDATPGRLLTVGGFGLGGTARDIPGGSIAAAQLESGFYHFVGTSVSDGPFSNAFRGLLVCIKGQDGRRRFLAWRDASSFDTIDVWHGAQATDGSGAIIWSAAVNQSTLLGPVSQSGGAPTGAVIERGANANGDYVRFADGTQMCWVRDLDMGSVVSAGSGSFADPYRTDAAINVTWPVAFSASVPAVSVAIRLAGDSVVNATARPLMLQAALSPSTTGWASLRAQRVSADATDREALLSVLAIGRWF